MVGLRVFREEEGREMRGFEEDEARDDEEGEGWA
jgi:hypothetical protein